MSEKEQIHDELAVIFNRWQVLLSSLSEAQVHTPLSPSEWTVKDVVAHLWSWQQGSVARMQAALQNDEPDYPQWWKVNGPDPEEDIDRTNAYIYKSNLDRPWPQVVEEWKAQFMHYLELTRQLPEKDLLKPGRYAWMGKYALADSCMGSLNHHKEHMETLSAWLREHADITSS